jgi:predicted 3-demethylubiquinone-9 3-methyltransferase (glyoxalase superfamily)
MQKITPFLWFDDDAEEAAKLYVSAFKGSKMGPVTRYDEASAKASGRPAGSAMTVSFKLAGMDFGAINGGPVFKFTPAVSFFVSCRTRKELDSIHKKLSKGGTELMPLGEYPFAKRYAWFKDKYGLSWQLILAGSPQRISPCLMFTGKQHGKAEEAMGFYSSLFKNSGIRMVSRYEEGEDTPGTIKHARFSLAGEEFIAMDSGLDHKFGFSEATSFVVNCRTQKEIDFFWERLSKGGDKGAQQCGWLKDRFGVSWQVVPTALPELLGGKDAEGALRAMAAMLKMKKLDIKALKAAYKGGR